jgi:crotonobetainyl-CoA:carnitine CoA-transferase CaiB-like acyl-CoA transferase
MHAGGKPMWSFTSFGDTGNGYLSAVGILQALYHRKRTGEGQFVDTSIVNACLLNTSGVVTRPDGTGWDRPRLDKMQTGFNAGCRLYETQDDWICVVAATEAHWDALLLALGVPELAAAYPDAAARAAGDAALSEALAAKFKTGPAADWMAKLDAAGVPAEISSATFSRALFDDAELRERRWTVDYQHPVVGKLEQIGLLYSLSETPGVVQSGPLMVGDNTEAILKELGYDKDRIDALLAQNVIGVWPPRGGATAVKSPWDPGVTKAAAADT